MFNTEREERDHDVMYNGRKKERKDMYKVGGGITYDLYDLTGHNNDVCIYICMYGQIEKIPCITEERRMGKNQQGEFSWKNPSDE